MPGSKIKRHKQCSIQQIFEQMVNELSGPVDFDLPCSLKKWKSTHYVPIKRNIYLTKRRIEDDGIFCSCTSSKSTNGCDEDCHCGMLFSTCSSSCKCGSNCANKPFQYRAPKKMKVVKTEKCGFGLVADEDIKQGDFVIEYVGEVIDDKTCEERLWNMKGRGNTNFYLCEVSHDMVIDATHKGNRSRFINHSCEPNSEMQKWSVCGETRVGIFALRDIQKGEEVTYDYNTSPESWSLLPCPNKLFLLSKFVQFGADQNCYCGALSCREKLGNKPRGSHQVLLDKRKTHFSNCIGELVRVWQARDKMYLAGYIYDFDNYSRKHTIMYVDRSSEIIDLSKEDWDFLPL